MRQPDDRKIAMLKARLKAWQDELETNKHGYAHYAEKNIAHLMQELASYREVMEKGL